MLRIQFSILSSSSEAHFLGICASYLVPGIQFIYYSSLNLSSLWAMYMTVISYPTHGTFQFYLRARPNEAF